jgi:CheY-like chemotaxis protein
VRLWFPRALAAHRGIVDDAGALKDRERSAALTDVAVLVVDDDEDGRRVLQLILTAQGANVHVAATTSEALTAAPAFRPDVIVADLAMPIEDGYSLLTQLRSAAEPWLRTMPVIAITAHARTADRERAIGGWLRWLRAEAVRQHRSHRSRGSRLCTAWLTPEGRRSRPACRAYVSRSHLFITA